VRSLRFVVKDYRAPLAGHIVNGLTYRPCHAMGKYQWKKRNEFQFLPKAHRQRLFPKTGCYAAQFGPTGWCRERPRLSGAIVIYTGENAGCRSRSEFLQVNVRDSWPKALSKLPVVTPREPINEDVQGVGLTIEGFIVEVVFTYTGEENVLNSVVRVGYGNRAVRLVCRGQQISQRENYRHSWHFLPEKIQRIRD